MVNETRTFGATALLTLVGLGVLLYGVSIDNGMELNAVMGAGGAVLLGAIVILTVGIMLLDGVHAEA